MREPLRMRRFGCVLLLLLALLLLQHGSCVVASSSAATSPSLHGVTVLVTAPPSYAPRLAHHLEHAGATVLCCPTVVTEHLEEDDSSSEALRHALENINCFDYIAFTSRRGIDAALRIGGDNLMECLNQQTPKAIALGADAEALVDRGVNRDSVLVPRDASPNGIVASLCSIVPETKRSESRILCPVPWVKGGLTEPAVVPNFLASLEKNGFLVHRVNAYQTKWTGPSAFSKEALELLEQPNKNCVVIAISSTAEVEGLLLLCQHYNLHLNNIGIVAHGPITARGAEELGVTVDAISKDYSSFQGMCDAVARCVASRLNE